MVKEKDRVTIVCNDVDAKNRIESASAFECEIFVNGEKEPSIKTKRLTLLPRDIKNLGKIKFSKRKI